MNKFITGGVVLAVVLSGLAFFGIEDGRDGSDGRVGAQSGPDHYDSQFFKQNITVGGGCFSTTTTGTLTAGDMARSNCIAITAAGAGQGTIALTLPTATQMQPMLPLAGDCRSWHIDTLAVDAATTTTITLGTGWDLVGVDANVDEIAGAEVAELTACRQVDAGITGMITEYVHAD